MEGENKLVLTAQSVFPSLFYCTVVISPVGHMPTDLQTKVFDFDRRIRYFGILDEMGRTATGGMRPGVKSLEPDQEAEMVDLQIAVTRGMAEAGSKYLGRTNYIIIHRERLMLIALPKKDRRTVLITAEPKFALDRLRDLIKIIDEGYYG